LSADEPATVAPILLFACGNPSRGDDALGPLLFERIEAASGWGGRVECLLDFQLQVEHALDLVGRLAVVFVDASVGCAAPFSWTRVTPARDVSYTSHAMSPTAVLQAYLDVRHEPPPCCWQLAIRGEAFELGEPPSPGALANLGAASAFLVGWIEAQGWRDAGREADRR
jgi:hydrogenase maturation protease